MYQFKTSDHPEANGREAQAGEISFHLNFNCEEFCRLTVKCGRQGMIDHAAMVLLMLENCPDLKAEALEAMKEVKVNGERQ
jgi:hypothetical protein